MSVAPDELATALDHRRAGRLEEAETACRQALDAEPGKAEAWHLLGMICLDLDRLEEGEQSFRRALELEPDDPATHHALARVLAEQHKLREAEAACRRALELDPELAQAYITLGKIFQKRGRWVEAESALATVLRLRPRDPEGHKTLGIVLVDQGRPSEALSSLEEAVRLQPDDASTHRLLAYALMQLGRFADAESQAREALRLKPGWAKAYSLLNVITGFESGDPDLGEIEAQASADGELPINERVHLYFTLAKSYDKSGDVDRAFEFLSTGNALERERWSSSYDVEVEERDVERIVEIVDGQLLDRLSGSGHESTTPVFIVGMPRSGTTLVEQILSSHPGVYGAGELDAVSRVAGAILVMTPDRAGYPSGLPQLEPRDLEELGRLYVSSVSKLAPDAARLTDKMPANFHYVGLIHLMLPHARIIHCKRDPADTCLSCYSTHFGGSLRWSYDLEDLGRYYRAYARLMAHWRRVLPEGRMLEVQYEDVVVDLEREARRLVEHCGLEWNDACLAFHKNERPVHTASLAQVRRPLYASSVGRWRGYEEHLGPLFAALGEVEPQG
jgi:Flp pilus assembly protein TadD